MKVFGNFFLFTYNFNAEKMNAIYKKDLLPTAKQSFANKNEDWILQENNDPKHRSKACSAWKGQNSIVNLDWPAQFLNANLIENVWALIKFKLRRKRFAIWSKFRN